MNEILPDVFHWTAPHPKVGIGVSSYWFAAHGLLLDPVVPDEGLAVFDARPPAHVVLTNHHHYRGTAAFVERFDCDVRCPAAGLDAFAADQGVIGFAHGELLAGGFEAITIGVLAPDETALYSAMAGGVVAIADGVVRRREGRLSCLPNPLLGSDPDAVKDGLRAAYVALCESRRFQNLLLAHGSPIIGEANAALRRFARES